MCGLVCGFRKKPHRPHRDHPYVFISTGCDVVVPVHYTSLDFLHVVLKSLIIYFILIFCFKKILNRIQYKYFNSAKIYKNINFCYTVKAPKITCKNFWWVINESENVHCSWKDGNKIWVTLHVSELYVKYI